jgi:hypothetical protein
MRPLQFRPNSIFNGRECLIRNLGATRMSSSNGEISSSTLATVFQTEIDKAAGSFEFAAYEGLTEYHNSPCYLQLSYDRYSRTVEDFLMVTRLFRRCLSLPAAESAVWREFETEAAQTLQNVQQRLYISDNRLTPEGCAADSNTCEHSQRDAADMFRKLAIKLRTISPLTQILA